MCSDNIYKCNLKAPFIELHLNDFYLYIPDNINNIKEQEKYVFNIVKKILIEKGFSENNIYYIKTKSKLDHAKNTHHATSIGTLKASTAYTTEQLMKGEHLKIKLESNGLVSINPTDDDIIDYGDMEPDKIELVKRIDKLKVENIDLKHAVEYYEKYIAWLEKNYIFILKSPSTLKETFDELVGEKNE